jgi:hypothetical protein
MWKALIAGTPQFTRLVVGCLPSASKHDIVVGLRAALKDELRLSSRFVVDGAEVVAGNRHNKLSLPHDTPNFRSPLLITTLVAPT